MPRTGWLSVLIAGSLLLSACAPGDVELNGKLFDAVGIGSGATSERSRTPKMADRAPLLLPPSLERLPPPETASSAPAQDGAFPIDPEQRSSMSAGELQRRQAAYCKEHYDRAVAFGDHARAATIRGPLGNCAPSALNAAGYGPLNMR